MLIPLEDSASPEPIWDFDSTVPGVLNTPDLAPIKGMEESLSHNRSPTTSILRSASSGLLNPTMASDSNSSERKWKVGLLFCVALILGVSFQNSYLGARNQMAELRHYRVNITVGDCGARCPPLGIVGQFG